MKKIKKIIFSLFFIVFSMFQGTIYANQPIYVEIDNKPLILSAPPVIVNDRVMVPMREIFTSFGYNIEWDNESKMIFANREDVSFAMQIGNSEVTINNKLSALDSPPFIKNDKTFVPLRFISEASNAEVSWIPEKNLVKIYKTTKAEGLEEELKKKVVMLYSQDMQGSGCIISNNGIIVTNYHVVDDVDFLKVKFDNGTIYNGEVKLIGVDVAKDIAILKIDKATPDFALIQDLSKINSNEKVLAIGSPNLKLNTVTYGNVLDFDKNNICFSAKIQNGSSGGALFDAEGKLIGITTAGNADETVGFAMPAYLINTVTKNMNINITESKNYSNISYPVYGVYTKKSEKYGNSTDICFGRVLNADYYKLYESDSKDGKYKDSINPIYGKNKWRWGFPSCITVSNTGEDVYFVVSSVKNGVESAWSDPVLIK